MSKWCPNCKKQMDDPGTSDITKYALFWRDNKCYSCGSTLIIETPLQEPQKPVPQPKVPPRTPVFDVDQTNKMRTEARNIFFGCLLALVVSALSGNNFLIGTGAILLMIAAVKWILVLNRTRTELKNEPVWGQFAIIMITILIITFVVSHLRGIPLWGPRPIGNPSPPTTTENPNPTNFTEEPRGASQTRTIVDHDLFGNLAFGMSYHEVLNLGGFYSEGPAPMMDGGQPGMLDRYMTVMNEYVKLTIHFYGPSRTVNGVVLVFENCKESVVKPSGMKPSIECTNAVDKFANALTQRFGTQKQGRVPFPNGGGYTDKTMWPAQTVDVSYQIVTSVDKSGYTAVLNPMFIFEKRKE